MSNTIKAKIKDVTKIKLKPIVPEFLDDWHKETEKLKAKINRLEKANERLTKENEAYRLIIHHRISQAALLERYPELRIIKE
jgi:chaperonin cofactor prefoldin